jgi:DNA topoisomerase-1
MSEPIEAYCVKCKTKRQMNDPQPVFTERGQPATRGTCPVCGTTLFRMGGTPAHAGLNPDEHMVVSKAKQEMRKGPKMVIVESPAKARTVGKFLGRGYLVRPSVGHIRDLPQNRLGVDIENDFEPHYVIPAKKKGVVRELKDEAKQASEVYLATDPDREGEAISWHLVQALGRNLNHKPVHRVEFHEITRDAIDHAFSHPRKIDMQRVNAQQARRILDRLVGYPLSSLLRDKMSRRGLSAGRVQSVAVRLIVEREREIMAFVPVEYWSIEAELSKVGVAVAGQPGATTDGSPPHGKRQARTFIARLIKINGQDADLKNRDDTYKIVDALETAAYRVLKVDKRERRRSPAAPFTTSTLQQEASRRLGFTAKRTMAVAQQLYEGVDIGPEGSVGLITYMRTDSTNVAEVAQAEARTYIAQRFGPEFVPPKPPVYKTRAKGAQEAHEAIRPTSTLREPQALKPYLDSGQFRLYDLIWKRFVASQMAPAILDTTSVDVTATNDGKPQIADGNGQQPATDGQVYLFRATGSVVKFPGFLSVYEEAREEGETKPEEEGEGKVLPPLEAGEPLDLVKLLPEQHFTQPPPRYSEATLVKALEEYGIGRPSTYAPIISTIQQRNYVERVGKQLRPTELGFLVNDLLVEHFPEIVDVGFTAHMEEDLDLIASGERQWVPVLRDFYQPFSATLHQAERTMPKIEIKPEPTGEKCELCGGDLVIKLGRFGKFIGCSNYPACRNSKPILIKTGAHCPECGGDIVEKTTRRKRIFYSCANYPTCTFSVWKKPLPTPCPACGGLLVIAGKDTAQCIQCKEQFPLEQVEPVPMT